MGVNTKTRLDSVSSGLLESGIGDSLPGRAGFAGAPLGQPRGAQIVQYSFFGSIWLRIRL